MATGVKCDPEPSMIVEPSGFSVWDPTIYCEAIFAVIVEEPNVKTGDGGWGVGLVSIPSCELEDPMTT